MKPVFALLVCCFAILQLSGQDWEAPTISFPDRQDSSLWDKEMLAMDTHMLGEERAPDWDNFPLTVMAFPVIEYEYGATGTGEFFMEEAGKKLSFAYYLVGKEDYNQADFKGEETHYSFFNFVLLTDTLETEEYGLVSDLATSRNHPDYVGEGRIRTKGLPVDYVCFHRPDGTSYALVGTRLFDLSKGETVIGCLQKDGSIHFLQLETPRLFMSEIKSYLTWMVRQAPVKAFLDQPGNVE